ncbi:adenylate/guanylate cyclase domain-containing protein [Desulfosarcina ovata]|uniref:adenylate/guanylate cyclase domain-containing protein n=1 Tax=Desulfosarcina ovata TaxID=83564 RepID=UPI001566705D|nr:adenylate/guanylate cyclase domain-containing protein [Desulfosarcina ovata]
MPHRLVLTDKIFLGRVCRGIEPDKCIIVRNPTVSRDHAVVRLTRDGVEITDLSKNGTWVNDVRMAPGASRQLADGDCISLGGTAIIRISHPQAAPLPSATDTWGEQTAIKPAAAFITSLVADVRGFTAFSQHAESADVYTFIKAIFARFTTIVNAHHGTVKDYIGDAVFAFWEHPDGCAGDYAVSACQAAIDQMRSVPEIHRQLIRRGLTVEPPRLGWGLTSGLITLSHFGSRSADLALVGDCVNLAFRLSSMASKTLPGPIVMCAQTASLVSARLPLVDLGNQSIRGRAGEEHLFGLQVT